MRRQIAWTAVGVLALIVAGCGRMVETDMDPLRWERLPTLPDPLGFGGPFAGTSQGALIVAGGANFPVSLFEGGEKVWHDRIFVLTRGTATWRQVGKLPRPLAYGCSVSARNGAFFLGGCDAERCYDDVLYATWEDGEVKLRPLAKLPKPCAFACAALVGNTLYVAGGQDSMSPKAAMKNFWALDLAKPIPQWQTLEPWPGPARIKAVAGSLQGGFYLFSGVELVPGPDGKTTERYLKDAYCYRPETGWAKLPDLPKPVAAAPKLAQQYARRYLMIFGGSDGAYRGPLEQHPGFSHDVLGYDVRRKKWGTLGTMPVARVTTTTVLWSGLIVIPTGEMRPGVRSPEVHAAKPWTRYRLKRVRPVGAY